MSEKLAVSFLLSILWLVAACAPPAEDAPIVNLLAEASVAAAVIDAEMLRAPIGELGSDDYQGRGPGSEGDREARAYLVNRLQELGFEPGAEAGGWEQTFPIVGVDASVPEMWRFERDGKGVDLAWWDEFIAFSGVQAEAAAIESAELVFVGHGIQAPEYGWDDFKGADVTGKVLVIMNNDPDWDDALFEGVRRLYYGRWDYKYEKAAELGAAGAIIIHTTPSAGYPFQVVQSSWTGPQFEIPAGDEPRIQIGGWTTEDAMRRIFELAGQDLDAVREAARSKDFEPVPLGVTTSLALSLELEMVETANVLGVLPGRDPELAEQYVIYTAHHDHLGVGKPNDAGDDIYNGGARQRGRRLPGAGHRPCLCCPSRAAPALDSRRPGGRRGAGAPGLGLLRRQSHRRPRTSGRQPQLRRCQHLGQEPRRHLHRLRQIVPRRGGREVRRRAGPPPFRAISSPTAASSTALTSSTSPRSVCPRSTSTPAPISSIVPRAGGREQMEAWEAVHYHQPDRSPDRGLEF